MRGVTIQKTIKNPHRRLQYCNPNANISQTQHPSQQRSWNSSKMESTTLGWTNCILNKNKQNPLRPRIKNHRRRFVDKKEPNFWAITNKKTKWYQNFRTAKQKIGFFRFYWIKLPPESRPTIPISTIISLRLVTNWQNEKTQVFHSRG